jgi:hypothetical protein
MQVKILICFIFEGLKSRFKMTHNVQGLALLGDLKIVRPELKPN